MASHPEFQVAQEAGVIVKEANVGRSGRRNVASNRGGKKRLPLNQRKVVNLPWLQRPEGNSRFHVRRWDFD